MSKFAQVGDFCPNKACADYGERQGEQQHNIIRFGKTKAGRQRFRCKTCVGRPPALKRPQPGWQYLQAVRQF